MIPCDYCEKAAVSVVMRGPRPLRSFPCEEHKERAYNAVDVRERWTDPPIDGRSRFEDENADEVTSRLRAAARSALNGKQP